MYAHNPRSRIAREFFFILNALREHYRALMRLDETETIRFTKLMTLLAVYMIREEGFKKFTPTFLFEQTEGALPRSSVHKAVKRLYEEGILEEEYGEYICLARTPNFLINPEELYGRPLTQVKDKDYDLEEKITEIVASMLKNLPPSQEYVIQRPPPPVKDEGRLTQPVYQRPSISVEDLKKELKKPPEKSEKKPKEDIPDEERNEVEEELGDFFM